jgi:hypothetical protein
MLFTYLLRKISQILSALLVFSSSYGQYSHTGEFSVNGNIVIEADGTNSPVHLSFKRLSDGWNAARIVQKYSQTQFGAHLTFETNGYSSLSNLVERMRITADGNVGIGTTIPLDKLHVYGNMSLMPDDAGSTPTYINFKRASDGWNAARIGQRYAQVGYGSHLVFETNANGSLTNLVERMRITYDGNVLIAKTSQINTSYKLDVNGSIRSNEIVVNTTGADFVFDNHYKLPKLSEVERYILEHKHLPEIQSADEMQKDGVEIGQLNTKLLQKVEELTLYVIDLQKQVIQLQELNRMQQESTLTRNVGTENAK